MTVDTLIDYAVQMGHKVIVEVDGCKVCILPAVSNTAEKPELKSAQGRPTQLDHGKICALYKAGWSISAIADEMGCSRHAVSDHLTKEGLKA